MTARHRRRPTAGIPPDTGWIAKLRGLLRRSPDDAAVQREDRSGREPERWFDDVEPDDLAG